MAVEVPMILCIDGETISHQRYPNWKNTGNGTTGGYVHKGRRGFGCPQVSDHRWQPFNGSYWEYYRIDYVQRRCGLGNRDQSPWD